MKVKRGKLLTRRRVFLVNAYTQRRYTRRPMTGVTAHWNHPYYIAWKAWVADFERFMLHGYGKGKDESRVATRRDVAHETPHLEKPTVAHASRPDRPTVQVD